MTGYRIGFAVGDAKLIAGLKKVKSQIDSGAPMFIQRAMIKALEMYEGAERPQLVKDNIKVYQERRDVLVKGLRNLGFKIDPPKGTFYLWLKVDMPSMKFAEQDAQRRHRLHPGRRFRRVRRRLRALRHHPAGGAHRRGDRRRMSENSLNH